MWKKKQHFDTEKYEENSARRWLDDDYEYEKLMIVTAWQQLHAHTKNKKKNK